MTKQGIIDAAYRAMFQQLRQMMPPTSGKLPGNANMLGYMTGGNHTQWFWRSSQGYDLAIQTLSVAQRGKVQLERQPIVTNDLESIALARSVDAVNYLLSDKRLPQDFFQVPTVSRYEPLDWIVATPRGGPTCRLGGALVVAALPQAAARMLLELVAQSRRHEAIFRYPTQQWVLDNGTLVDLPHGAPKYDDPNDGGQVLLQPGASVTVAGEPATIIRRFYC